jgi:hypothetical protein
MPSVPFLVSVLVIIAVTAWHVQPFIDRSKTARRYCSAALARDGASGILEDTGYFAPNLIFGWSNKLKVGLQPSHAVISLRFSMIFTKFINKVSIGAFVGRRDIWAKPK